jgi:hypothetical protein
MSRGRFWFPGRAFGNSRRNVLPQYLFLFRLRSTLEKPWKLSCHLAMSTACIESVTIAAAPVPEPETYAILLAALGMLGWKARSRR